MFSGRLSGSEMQILENGILLQGKVTKFYFGLASKLFVVFYEELFSYFFLFLYGLPFSVMLKVEEDSFMLGIKKKIFYGDGIEVLAQVAKKSVLCLVPAYFHCEVG